MEMRTCRKCGESKPDTREHWADWRIRAICNACLRIAYNKQLEADRVSMMELRRKLRSSHIDRDLLDMPDEPERGSTDDPWGRPELFNIEIPQTDLTALLPEGHWKATVAAFQQRCAFCGRGDEELVRAIYCNNIWGKEAPGPVLGNVVPACVYCASSKEKMKPRVWLQDDEQCDKIEATLDKLRSLL